MEERSAQRLPGPEAVLPEALLSALRHASSVVVITGAGVSAESGVPTFRGSGGLWRQFRAEDLATPEAFARDPALVWEWYEWRRSVVARCQPNAAHEVVARMDRHYEDFLLVTQNVDGLHERAGSRRLVEIHGSMFRLRCTDEPSHLHPYPKLVGAGPERSGKRTPEAGRMDEKGAPSDPRSDWTALPRCPSCGALGRPDVVWFGEMLNQEHIDRAVRALETCEVALVIGTSGVVQPVASLPGIARRAGAQVAILNLEPSPLAPLAHHEILGPAGRLMSDLGNAVGFDARRV